MSYQHGPASVPPQNNPASIPPQNNFASIPPQSQPISQPPSAPVTGPPSRPPSQPPRRASTQAPTAVSSPSLSMMPPKRSGAMIAFVLVLDLALAAAGATLLVKGLAKPKAADAKPAKVESRAQAAAPTPAAVAGAPVAAAVAPAAAPPPPPLPEPAGSAAAEPAEKTLARDPKKKAATTAKAEPKDGKKKVDGPVDPYGAGGGPAAAAPPADRSEEIEGHARDSFGSFRRCFSDAIHGSPIHGDVRIAFVIEPDGHVDHAAPVVNTTGSDVLAKCLAQTIGTWTFAPHPGAATTYERPFNYP